MWIKQNRIVLSCLAMMVCLSVGGCNVVRVSLNTPLTPNDIAFITPGNTTFTDVVTQLGSPDTIGESETGMIATYRYLDLKYSRVNFGWLAKPWTPVDPDLIFSRTGLGVDAFQIAFDPHGVVVHSSFQRRLSGLPFYPYPF